MLLQEKQGVATLKDHVEFLISTKTLKLYECIKDSLVNLVPIGPLVSR
jgi:hypothetical protein